MAVRVKEVGEKDNIAVRVVLLSNEVIGTTLVKGKNGQVFEPEHSRFREDGQQIITDDDVCIPLGDYKEMFFMAGGILGKPRRKKPRLV